MKATVTLLTLVLMASIGKAQTSPPEFKIGVNPNVVKPDNGKLPASVPIAVYAQDCASTTDFSKFTLTATGGLNPTAFVRGKCLIKSTLNIEASVKAGTYYIILVSDGGKTVGHTEFSVTDANAGLTPPGLAPQVDALYNVMTFRDCSDAFGRRVAKSMYCIQVKIGNNSGYPLQIAGMGFSRKLEALAALGYPTVTIANNSYASTRAILVHEEAVSTRNVAFEILEASGLILGSSAPFFNRTNPKKNLLAFSSIVNGPLQQAYNLIFPDPILQQLRNLDDESFRDNKIIPNNSQIQTVIFVDKQALTQSLDELQIQLNQAANEQRPEAKTTEQEKLRAQINQSVLDDMRAAAAETAKDSTRPSLLELWWKGNSSPLLVKLALGNLVIVGDEIQYLQRVQVQSSSPTSGVAVTVSPANPSLNAKATQPFTATVTGTTTISVTWSVKCDATAKDACGKIDSSSGQYTAPDTPPDPSTVTVTATSTADNTKTGSTTITIIPALTFSTSSPLPAGKAGQPYPQQTISATGGNGAYTYTGGPPPPDGLSMNLVGAINGTPKTATGSTPATFTVTATDSSSPPRTGTATFSITITP